MLSNIRHKTGGYRSGDSDKIRAPMSEPCRVANTVNEGNGMVNSSLLEMISSKQHYRRVGSIQMSTNYS